MEDKCGYHLYSEFLIVLCTHRVCFAGVIHSFYCTTKSLLRNVANVFTYTGTIKPKYNIRPLSFGAHDREFGDLISLLFLTNCQKYNNMKCCVPQK